MLCALSKILILSLESRRGWPAVFNITPHEDDNVVAKMRVGGPVFTGEDEYAGIGFALLHGVRGGATGAPRGPVAFRWWSSGGAAAAVAAGLAPMVRGRWWRLDSDSEFRDWAGGHQTSRAH